MARAIDGDELLGIERLLDTGIVRQSKTASWLLDQVLHDIQAMPTLTPPNEWVSVEERLPIKSGEYLAYTTDENIGLIEFDEDCGEFGFSKEYYQDGAYLDSEWTKADWITHWMPLSEPPGKDNNVPTKAPNEPLSLEQLREMDGEPVWIEDVKHWALIDIEKGGQWDGMPFAVWAENGVKFTYNVESRDLHCYRRPPEGEEET